jgi:hypothetical protein
VLRTETTKGDSLRPTQSGEHSAQAWATAIREPIQAIERTKPPPARTAAPLIAAANGLSQRMQPQTRPLPALRRAEELSWDGLLEELLFNLITFDTFLLGETVLRIRRLPPVRSGPAVRVHRHSGSSRCFSEAEDIPA